MFPLQYTVPRTNAAVEGGVRYGVGSRIKLKHTRAIIDAIHSGELSKQDYSNTPVFNLRVCRLVKFCRICIICSARFPQHQQRAFTTDDGDTGAWLYAIQGYLPNVTLLSFLQLDAI